MQDVFRAIGRLAQAEITVLTMENQVREKNWWPKLSMRIHHEKVAIYCVEHGSHSEGLS